ncbi:hypothetical protein Tco_1077693 [Tanacetum coccineum]
MSFPNYPTSNIEDTFSSNLPNYITASPDYVPASLGKTYSSSSNNSFCLVPTASPTLLLFHDNPYVKIMQAFYAKESPIPPPDPITPPPILTPYLVLPPSLLFDPQYFFVPEELLPPKNQLSRKQALCACARYQVNPKVLHLHAMKRIFRYLKGQPKLGLWYPKDLPFDLVAYTDSDYAGASLDRKSTTGGYQFLRSRLISWQCKKQNVVANSTTKAEYLAASSCCGQVL